MAHVIGWLLIALSVILLGVGAGMLFELRTGFFRRRGW